MAAELPEPREIVREHWSAVFRLAHSLCGRRHEAEDVTQETFLRALQKLDSFQPGSNLRAWLLRIATNAYFDSRRKRSTVNSESEGEEASREPPPGQTLETAERAQKVRAALLGLSELSRLVFHLRVEDELSFREIAELAGTTEQSARWHLHHARTKLLELLGDDG